MGRVFSARLPTVRFSRHECLCPATAGHTSPPTESETLQTSARGLMVCASPPSGVESTMIRVSNSSSYACPEGSRRAGYGKSVRPVRRGLRSVPQMRHTLGYSTLCLKLLPRAPGAVTDFVLDLLDAVSRAPLGDLQREAAAALRHVSCSDRHD